MLPNRPARRPRLVDFFTRVPTGYRYKSLFCSIDFGLVRSRPPRNQQAFTVARYTPAQCIESHTPTHQLQATTADIAAHDQSLTRTTELIKAADPILDGAGAGMSTHSSPPTFP